MSIWAMIGRRLAWGAATLLVVSALISAAVEALPGDVAQTVLGQGATEAAVAAMRAKLGLDQPALTRHADWLAGAAVGDFGASLISDERVADKIGRRLGATAFLALYAAAVAVPLALALGIAAAMRRDGVFDRAASLLGLAAISAPEFLIGYLLVFGLAIEAGLFPATARLPLGGIDLGGAEALAQALWAAFLPALTLVLVTTAHMMRMTRAAMLQALDQPYVEMARLKGASPARVALVHALPNALAPILSVVALNLAYLITGVVIVEAVFAYPGLGQLMVDSVAKRDLPVVQACTLIFASVFIVLNLAADIGAMLADPRLRRPR